MTNNKEEQDLKNLTKEWKDFKQFFLKYMEAQEKHTLRLAEETRTIWLTLKSFATTIGIIIGFIVGINFGGEIARKVTQIIIEVLSWISGLSENWQIALFTTFVSILLFVIGFISGRKSTNPKSK